MNKNDLVKKYGGEVLMDQLLESHGGNIELVERMLSFCNAFDMSVKKLSELLQEHGGGPDDFAMLMLLHGGVDLSSQRW